MQHNGKEIHPLKKARIKLGYTQVILADFAQVGEATIQRAESGKPLRPDTIQQLCNYFTEQYQRPVTPEELGLISEEPQQPPTRSSDDISLLLMKNLLENQAFLATLRQSVLQDFARAISDVSGQAGNSPHLASANISQINEELVVFFESMMQTQWNTYYTGGTERVIQGLNVFLKELEKLAHIAQRTMWHHRVLRLLTLGYQLQSCVLRDRLHYAQANIAYQKAFNVAQELEDNELMASALARHGVTLVQQSKPQQALLYLDNALSIIEGDHFPKLEGYILQALSEAYAQDKRVSESWSHLERAQAIRVQSSQEESFIRFNPASTLAQRGVDAVFLKEYRMAIESIDQSLKNYDPTGVSGRARLIAMKAEAQYKMGVLDACLTSAQEALALAQAVGVSKIVARIKKLHAALEQSRWKEEDGVTQLGFMLTHPGTETA